MHRMFCATTFCLSSRSMTHSSKRISFNESVTVHPIGERLTEMSPLDKLQAYYSKHELLHFESEAKEVRARIIHQALTMSKSNPAVSPAEIVSSILESDASLRGFEVRFCPDRRRKKSMVLNAVHEYQKKLKLSEDSFHPQQKAVALAKVYSQLSRWSKIQALQIARNDEIRAFQQDDEGEQIATLTSPVSCTSHHSVCNLNEMSPAAHVKRKVEFSLDERQEKRRKIC